MKRLLTCTVLAFLSVLLFAASAFSAGKTGIILLSTPFGTGSYVLGTAMESIVNKGNYSITVAHAETPGQAFNINKLSTDAEARKHTVVTASSGINWLAERGAKPFPAKRTPLLLIGGYNYCITWLVTTDASIKTMADLKGKRIAMGRIPQPIWGYEPDALLKHGYSDDFYKSLKIQYVGTSEAATALVNGQVDAATVGGYIDPINGAFSPAPQTVEVVASGRPLIHLDWTKEAVERTASRDIVLTPYQVPPNSVEGQSAPLWAGADKQGFFAHPELPEELAYEFTKAMIENADAFVNFHAMGALISKEGLVKGWKEEDIHPGALRAYKEAGIL